MFSKNKLKFIKSLQIKKFRKQENSFLIEGAKSVEELIDSDFKTVSLFLTEEYFNCYKAKIEQKNIPVTLCSKEELASAGSFSTNNAAIAIAEMVPNILLTPAGQEYLLLLDDIKDPGNLGTIIRIADWYGIKKIICSENTAEFYNPKVIAATMGSFTRVKTFYGNLNEYLQKHKTFLYGAKLHGDNIHKTPFNKEGMLLIGNESNGINPELEKFIDQSVLIPRFGKAESLNAGIATAIICDNIFRQLS